MLCVYTYEYVEVMVKKLLEDKKRERERFISGMVCAYTSPESSPLVCVFFLLCFVLCFFFLSWGADRAVW